MSEPAPTRVPLRNGAIWVVLTLLLLFGTVASAFFVYGVTDLWNTGRLLDLPILIGGGLAAGILFLLLAGVLYRVDRFRGVAHREVRLFE